jgi:anti-sigma factor RsiW
MSEPVDCTQARELMLDDARGRLSEAESAALRLHRDTCPACRAMAQSDQALSDALEKLPQHAAPLALKRRLAARWPLPASAPRRTWRRFVAPALCAAAALAVAGVVSHTVDERGAAVRLATGEAVNDHLRILEGAPLSKVTGGLHEVKPWFGGKLDFAPSVLFAGDEDFPLTGGAIERFLDRQAAVFVYKRRLHTISLFVVRAEGLGLSETPRIESVRGFNIVLWRKDGQAFALVSDLNSDELSELHQRLAHNPK